MQGLLLIDKPRGMTSFDVIGKVRRAVDESKVGHMGTLDKAATGLLAVMIGRCTKLQRFTAAKVSTYEFEMKFGVQTDSLDTNGEVVRECEWEHVTEGAVREALGDFVGVIEQRPPRFSAVKIDGRRASDWARDEEAPDMEPEPREIEIRRLELRAWEPPLARFEMECVSGTYVRSLVRDLAEKLDSCAHATAIRRTASNHFSIEDAIGVDELDEGTVRDALLPPLVMVESLPHYELDQEEARLVGFGTAVRPDEAGWEALDADEGDFVALVDPEGELAAVARIEVREGALALQPRRVMKPDSEKG